MAKVDTVNALLRPMMGKPSIKRRECVICGRTSPLNDHHIVRRGAGKAYDESGRELRKPTITLCGAGNVLSDADGARFCHGMAHNGMLHFRWVEGWKKSGGIDVAFGGHWEFLITEEPTRYQDALAMEGWRSIYERD